MKREGINSLAILHEADKKKKKNKSNVRRFPLSTTRVWSPPGCAV